MERTLPELEAIAAFADALPTAIWVGRAPTGACVYVNREFNRILGIEPPQGAARGNYVGPYGVRRVDGSVYPEEEMPYERVMRARAPVMVDDLVIHRHDGGRNHLRVFASPLFDEAGEIAYVVEAFTDISREVEADQARRESERQLQIAQRLESIGSLAGGLAHDFNNLLSIVKLVAGQLAEAETDPGRLELIGHLVDVSDSAAKLTRALLGFAQQRRRGAQPVEFDVAVGSVVELGRRTFGRGLVIEANLGAGGAVVDGDGGQIEQVVMNLLINARDAIGTGPGRIDVRTRAHHLAPGQHGALPPGDYVTLEVTDTGSGIDPAIRDRVFEPYVTTKTMGATKGTGLGLSTVYGIAKAHGGLAEVGETAPGRTVLRAFFQARPGAAVTAAAPEVAAAPDVRGSGTIVVVDDEPLVRIFTCRALETLGYHAIPVEAAAAAPAAVEQGRDSVVALVLDMTMPGPTVQETCAAVQRLKPGLPVVVMTGAALSVEAQERLGPGVRGFLQKPFDAAALSVQVAAAIAASAGQRAMTST